MKAVGTGHFLLSIVQLGQLLGEISPWKFLVFHSFEHVSNSFKGSSTCFSYKSETTGKSVPVICGCSNESINGKMIHTRDQS